MSNLAIRRAKPEDHAALADLILQLNRYEDAISSDRTTDLASAQLRLADHLETLRDDATAALLVAEAEGEIVGYTMLLVETRPNFVREEMRRVGYISELCVTEKKRGAGIGKALLAEAEIWARALRLSHLGLTALAGNALARKRYQQSGFEDYAAEMMRRLD